MVADCHRFLARWRNHISQLLNVHGVKYVRQTETRTVEPLVPDPSAFDVELAIEKLKRHKSPGTDQTPAELIQAGGRTMRSEIHKLINSKWNKKELPEEWKESIVVAIYKKGDKTDCINYRVISLLPTTYKIVSNILLSRLTPYSEEIIGDHQCGFRRNRSTTDHTLMHFHVRTVHFVLFITQTNKCATYIYTYININNISYMVSTFICFNAYALSSGSLNLVLAKVTELLRLLKLLQKAVD